MEGVVLPLPPSVKDVMELHVNLRKYMLAFTLPVLAIYC